jgi:hypothetical protein
MLRAPRIAPASERAERMEVRDLLQERCAASTRRYSSQRDEFHHHRSRHSAVGATYL